MADSPDSENARKLWDLVERIRVGMLTTVVDGALRSRPTVCVDVNRHGALWSFTTAVSSDRDGAAVGYRVNLGLVDRDTNDYASLAGMAKAIRDPARAKQLWDEALSAWFPKGVDDPDLALLRIQVEQAEYWDRPPEDVIGTLGLVKLVTDETPSLGKKYKLVFAETH